MAPTEGRVAKPEWWWGRSFEAVLEKTSVTDLMEMV